ncbi:phosducin-like protein [Sitophilus oryzae]|uniref:Phosducin-like protein n=1 Tax=Sitophilus oryzae TaxID=7048 RepID=A0A6J2XGD5_SITOR|nr:phosducin-like protein [Sitophilus oryzae]XP_030750006.1 phosducin-like protein [Sitophilus oryzae]
MATLEDKILGEKLHNYCSSSEGSDNEGSGDEAPKPNKTVSSVSTKPLPEANKWEGTSTNTGPKGVIEDWRKFKQLEIEKREEGEKVKIELAKKLTMTVRTALDEEREKAALEDPDLAELLNDEFLLNYQKQRMEEMLQQTNKSKTFGEVILLRNGQEYLDAIDKEDPSIIVIIHIYEDHVEACRLMNQSLKQLSKIHQHVKFCAIVASQAGVSREFKVDGVPALLVYKSGNIIGNFVKLTDDLGQNFQTEDVQGFLVEHGLLEDKSLTPALIRSSTADSDSD